MFKIKVQNVGRTPAYEVRVYGRAYHSVDAALPELNEEDCVGLGVLSPGVNLIRELRFEKPLTDSEFAELQTEGTKHFTYVFGRVVYWDAFGIKRFHDFRFNTDADDFR